MPAPPPPKTRIGRILREHPEARVRLGRGLLGLAATVCLSLVAIVALLLWHSRRRADIIRSRLGKVRGGPLIDPSPRGPTTEEDRPA